MAVSNVHYSLLPKYRGAAPMAWTLVHGEEKTGVTIIRLVEKMDAGPILARAEISVSPQDTAASLESRLVPLGAQLLRETIEKLKTGTIREISQNERAASLAPLLKKEDGRIDWNQPASAIERRVRAFNPWPSAYTHWQRRLMKIHRASLAQSEEQGVAGEVIRADQAGLWIATGAGVLSLEEVQLENRKRLPASDFLKGARIQRGEKL